jgi:glucose-6-phosphate isomerase
VTPTVQAFAALDAHRASIIATPMRKRFADDPDRFKKFSLTVSDIVFDYSKNLIDEETIRRLIALAEAAEVEKLRSAMFAGEAINRTENRPVLHVALRAAPDEIYRAEGKNVVPEVQAMLSRMTDFCDRIRSGAISGMGGKFTDVVNIGIGGSDRRWRRGPCAPSMTGRGCISSPMSTARIFATRSPTCRHDRRCSS